MNNLYTLIYLAKELKAILANSQFTYAVTYKKNVLDIFFADKDKQIKLSVSTDSVYTACFTDPRTSSRKTNSTEFFETMSGFEVADVKAAPNDRILYISFHQTEAHFTLKLFGNEPNVFLAEGGVIRESFKSPGLCAGKPEPEPYKANSKLFSNTTGKLKRRVHQSFPLLPRNFIQDLIYRASDRNMSDEEIADFFTSAENQLKSNPKPAILGDGRFTLFSEEYVDHTGAESFNFVNDAIRIAFYTGARENRHEKRLSEIMQKAEKLSAKYNGIIEAAQNADKSLERAARYEELANILVSHAHMYSDNKDSITLPDFYNNNVPVEIKIDPQLDIAANAINYFDKKKKSERSYESAIQYGEETRKRAELLQTIMDKVKKTSHLREIEELEKEYSNHELLSSGKRQKNVSQRRWKVHQLGKYEVWIGKNAKSNDAVLRESHKEDIWMHASGLSGSHLILRMNKAANDPDKSILEQAAAWAAWMSKGKGSEFCPVKWTRRKFVRKPKGAAAGAVIVDRENIILAAPREPLKTPF